MSYIDPPIVTDPDELLQLAVDYMQQQILGYQFAQGNVETILLGACARMAARTADVASRVPSSIFRYYGRSILGLFPEDALSAVGQTTWTMRDSAGYTIPVGTQVGIRTSGDTLVAFQTLNEITVPPGSTATDTGAVAIVAVNPGAASSGVSGTVEPIRALDWVSSIVLIAPTTGGRDAQSEDDYLNALVNFTRRFELAPILDDDFALLAEQIPGVDRAAVLGGYNPADATFNNERMVTVVPLGADGLSVGSTIRNQVDATIQALREVNFDAHVIDATYTHVDVAVSFTVASGFTPSDVEDNVEATLRSYLDPANWGRPTRRQPKSNWLIVNQVRYLELATVINGVDGVDHITALAFGPHGGTQGTTDVTLSGAAPLPVPDTITATAV